MKLWAVILLTLLGGATIGVGATWFEFARDRHDFQAIRPAANDGPDSPAPRALIREETHDFGRLPAGARGSHRFLIRNAGTAPLKLFIGKKSCACTGAESPDPIPPGEADFVTVNWKVKARSRTFRATVTIGSNDPTRRQFELTITGTAALRAVPGDVIFSDVPQGETRDATVNVLRYGDEPAWGQPRVVGPAIEDHVRVTTQPIRDAAVLKENAAAGGRQVRIAIEPSMPLGDFDGEIVLEPTATLPEDQEQGDSSVEPVRIPIAGRVVQPVSFWATWGYDNEKQQLDLTLTKPGPSGRRRVDVVVRGKGNKDVELALGDIRPSDVLKVKLDKEPKQRGDSLLYPLWVERTPGQDAADPPQVATVTVRTTHPRVPELKLHVRLSRPKERR